MFNLFLAVQESYVLACDPIIGLAVATTVLGGAQAIGNFMAQKQAAELQIESQESQAKAAIDATLFNQTAQRIQQGQQQQSTAEEKFKSDRASDIAEAEAAVEGAEGNVSGISLDSLLDSYDAENARYNSAIDLQQEFRNTSTELNIKGTGIQLSQTLDQLSTPVQTPSYLSLGLDLANAGLKGATVATPTPTN